VIQYSISIYTGDVAQAGTDSNVTLKFFGSKGNSSDILIEKVENRFERGSVDTVLTEIDDIGSLKKVRVTNDAKGVRKEWYVERIEVTNQKTGAQYVFVCRDWIARTRDNPGGLVKDFSVLREGYESIQKTDYKIIGI
jgi:hypothetical protein